MKFQSSYAWQYGVMELQSKIGALPISPVEGEAGHTEGHATLHELLNEYVPNPTELNNQIWQKTGENTWQGEGDTPDYDDAGLQDYLSSMEDYYVQYFGKSPLFYIVNDNTGTDTSYTDTVSIPVGSKMYVGTKGLLSYIDNIAQGNSRLKNDLVNLTVRIESSEGKVSTLESDNSTLNATVSALESDNATLNTTVSQLGEDVTTLSNANSTLEGQVSTLESDNVSLNATVSELETDLGSLSSANDTLSSTVSTLEGNVSTLTSDKEALEGQVSTLESTIADLTTRLEALENPTNPE